MNIGSIFATTRTRILAATLTAALLGNALPATAAWQFAHADSANTGLARVDTSPATSPIQSTPVGQVAPHAGPVVGPDGTVYVGNQAGELRAFHADGKPFWTRQINVEHGGIFAAPVVGDDGSIYVVSSQMTMLGPQSARNDSFLHKFHPGGAWEFWRPFPEQFSNTSVANTGITTAFPNIWRSGGIEAIIVPVMTKGLGGEGVRVVAFGTNGAVLAEQEVTYDSYTTTGGSDLLDWVADCTIQGWWAGPFGCLAALISASGSFRAVDSNTFPLYGAGMPLPGAAIRPDPRGGPPFVVVSDGKQDKVAYSFSPKSGFSEVFRSKHLQRWLTTPPVVQGNGNTIVGTVDGFLTLTGPDFVQLPAIGGLGTLTAAPTRLPDGRLAVVSREGILSIVSGNAIVWQSQLPGQSVVSAAASCTHLFVVTTEEFITYDVATMARVARGQWVNGGLVAPVIGPGGHVYAIANNTLYTFHPPPYGGVLGRTKCDQLAPPSGPVIGQ